jgi:hypothetical protein
MTIEIHNPELENLLQQRISAGNFSSVEDMLLETFRGVHSDGPADDEKNRRAQAAADRIRELRQHSKPDPEGLTSLDYIRLGRR